MKSSPIILISLLIWTGCALTVPAGRHSAVPDEPTAAMIREPGVAETPLNTGNPAQDLNPHRGVRPNY